MTVVVPYERYLRADEIGRAVSGSFPRKRASGILPRDRIRAACAFLAIVKVIPHKRSGAMAYEFFVRRDGRNRWFTGGKSRFLQEADDGKGVTSAAAELCGVALTIIYLLERRILQ